MLYHYSNQYMFSNCQRIRESEDMFSICQRIRESDSKVTRLGFSSDFFVSETDPRKNVDRNDFFCSS